MTTSQQLTFSDSLNQSAEALRETPELLTTDNGDSPADLLLAHFDRLITRAEDIPRLNELILQLAVQGKLTPQDPADEPAGELLKRIRAEKERLVKEKKIRKPKKLPPIEPDEIPFDLPEGWVWVRLPEVYHDCGQTNPDQPFTYIDVSSINNAIGVIGDDLQVIEPADAPSRARKLVGQGTVIYSTVRPYLLNVAVVDREFNPPPIVSTAFAVMHPFEGVDNKFLFFYLRSKPFIEFVEAQMTGMAYPAISNSKLSKGLFPLPPLAEQKRIVEKVESLLAQTRVLEAELAAAEEERARLNRAGLHHLLAAPTPAAVSEQWQQIAALFDRLYTEPAAIEDLKQAILQLAVQGRLVPQHPDDEPASVLLERIKAEKKRLVKEKKIRKSKPLPPVDEDEMPFEVPEGWVWVRVGDIAKVVEYGTSHKASPNPRGVPILRMGNIENGEIVYNNLKYVPKSIKDLPRLYLKKNDLIFNRTNSYELVGKTGIHKEEDDVFTLASYLIRVSFLLKYTVADYINFFFNAPICRETQIEPYITQQTGQANFNGTKLRNVMGAVPAPSPSYIKFKPVHKLVKEQAFDISKR